MTAYDEMARIIMDAVAESFPAKQRDEIRSFWDPRPVVDAVLAAKQTQTCTTCGGTGHVVDTSSPTTRSPRNEVSFRPCGCSSGVVVGTEPLIILGPERVDPMEVFIASDGQPAIRSRVEPVYRRAGSPTDE